MRIPFAPITLGKQLDRKNVLLEFALVPCSFILTYLLAGYFELSEIFIDWTITSQDEYDIDELPYALAVATLAMSWFAWRRWQEIKREVRQRSLTEQALIAERLQFQTLFNENLAGNAVVSTQGVIQMCNPAMAGFLEIQSPELAVGNNLADCLQHGPSWAQLIAVVEEHQRVDIEQLSVIGLYGKRTYAMARVLGHFGQDGALQFLHVFAADITEIKTAESEISNLLKENHFLLRQALELQEEERRHIARDLHDDMGQYLNAIKANATSLANIPDLPANISEVAVNIIAHSDHIYRSARQLIHRLRPAALDELGLSAALQHLIDTWKYPSNGTRYELTIEHAMDHKIDHLDDKLTINIYRVIQEAITNAARHAQASLIQVHLFMQDGSLMVDIKDNGCGIPLTRPHKGLGLAGMRERIKAVDGKFELSSAAGTGTRIRAVIPTTQKKEMV
jgi:signal transduction histidine kinase